MRIEANQDHKMKTIWIKHSIKITCLNSSEVQLYLQNKLNQLSKQEKINLNSRNTNRATNKIWTKKAAKI